MPWGRHFRFALVTGAAVLACAPAASAEDAGPVPTHHRRFRELVLKPHSRVQDAAPLTEITLYVTTDDGVSWRPAAPEEARKDDAGFHFTAAQDGRYGFAMVGRDAAGLEGRIPTAGSPPQVMFIVDTTPPSVEIVEPPPNEPVRPGASLIVQWRATDANAGASPVSLMAAWNGGNAVPVAAARSAADRLALPIPKDARSLRLTAVAVDLAGNRGESAPVDVTVSATAPERALVRIAPRDEPPPPRRGFNIWYGVQNDQPAGLATVEVWYTTDGGATWVFHGRDEDLVPPFYFNPTKPGKYGFHLVAVKKNQEPSALAPRPGTPPQVEYIYDPFPPAVTLLSPRGGEHLRGGQDFEITWTASDDLFGEKPVSLWYTTRPPEWHPIADGVANLGSFVWKVPPVDTATLHVRVTAVDLAGHVTESAPSGPVNVDSQGPAKVDIVGIQSADPLAAARHSGPREFGAMRSARIAFERGHYLFEVEHNPLKAIAAFEEALKHWPEYVEALNDLAVIYYRNGQYDKAVDHFVRSKAADGREPRVLTNLAHCYRRLEEPDYALAEMETLASRFPELSHTDAAEAATLLLELVRDFRRRGNDRQARNAATLAMRLPNLPDRLAEQFPPYLQ